MTGLDSAECRANQHKDCRDDEVVACLCACHRRPSVLNVEMAIRKGQRDAEALVDDTRKFSARGTQSWVTRRTPQDFAPDQHPRTYQTHAMVDAEGRVWVAQDVHLAAVAAAREEQAEESYVKGRWRGQHDALAGAVQRVESLPWVWGPQPGVLAKVIAAIKGDSDAS
jgi:hypothetical protein